MNQLGNAVCTTEASKAKYDGSMKQILANVQILAQILKRFVPEFASYPLDFIEFE